MEYKNGEIKDGFKESCADCNVDARGWLAEIWRADQKRFALPAMSYISMTKKGITRGPHEHKEQIDAFLFLGTSFFWVYLWDARPDSPTYRNRHKIFLKNIVSLVIVKPGIVHAYQNIGPWDGYVINSPDRLYRGPHKLENPDEIRHENDANSSFELF